jgi:nucleoside diphosphate kinase
MVKPLSEVVMISPHGIEKNCRPEVIDYLKEVGWTIKDVAPGLVKQQKQEEKEHGKV